MINIKINGKQYRAKEDATILDVCRQNKIDIPTLCEYKDLNCIGACRLCVVEITGFDRLVAACNTKVEKGMDIHTKTPKVRNAIRTNLELILSEHNTDCTKCARNNNCTLQNLTEKFNIQSNPFGEKVKNYSWPKNFPLQRDNQKCIKCMRCIQVCDNVTGIHV